MEFVPLKQHSESEVLSCFLASQRPSLAAIALFTPTKADTGVRPYGPLRPFDLLPYRAVNTTLISISSSPLRILTGTSSPG